MRFTINLKPRNSAAYFTVREHLTAWQEENCPDLMRCTDRAGKLLRGLFNIPEHFRLALCQKPGTQQTGKYHHLLDDPATGRRLRPDAVKTAPMSLDLSFSFPYALNKYQNYYALMIDPCASLGVPVSFVMIFHSSEHALEKFALKADTPALRKEVWLLAQVLADIAKIGKDTIKRDCGYKAALLWQMAENSPVLHPTAPIEQRSKTIMTAACPDDFPEKMQKMGYETEHFRVGKAMHLSIASYATHSKETIELLYDRVMDL